GNAFFDDFRLQGADELQVALSFREVQSIAHHELVRDVESDLDEVLDLDLDGLRLAEQGHDGQGARLAVGEVLHQPGQGQAGVDDVLHDQDVAALDVAVQVLQDADDAGGAGGVAVGADGHELQLVRDLQLAGEVGDEEDGTLEHADEDEVLRDVAVALVNGGSEFAAARKSTRLNSSPASTSSAVFF